MKPYNITILSKNKQYVDNFSFFFNNNKKPNFYIIKKDLKKKKKKKILTILKSPHVNKTAQEQFEYRVFSKQYLIYSTEYFKYLIFLKKLKTNAFPDLKIIIKFNIYRKNNKQLKIKTFNLDNFNANFYKNLLYQEHILKNLKRLNIEKYKKKNYNSIEKTKILTKIFDLYGELIKSNLN